MFPKKKAIGRYVLGGKIYAGECSRCGSEVLMTYDQAKQLSKVGLIKESGVISRIMMLF